MEKLFVIESSKDKKQFIIGQLIKKDNGEYEYIPTRSAQQSSFTWTRIPFKGNNLPLYIKQRIFSEHNSGIDEFLKKINLEHYDEWEVLKRTHGKNPRDTLLFVAKDVLSKGHQVLIHNSNEMHNYKAKRVSLKKSNPQIVISHGIILKNLELKRRPNYIVAKASKNKKSKSSPPINLLIDKKKNKKKANLFKVFMMQ